MTDFLQEAKDLFPYTQSMRRDFHIHPELGFREIRTGGIVAKELEKLGLEVTKGVGKTGVVALLEGSKPGPTLLLRFDMDALPIVEETGASYASLTPGIMHACGHDGHTSIGLTVAKILQNHRNELAGTIKFCFQPSEEGFNDEDCGGNEMMIRDGVLDAPRVDRTLSLHLWNERPLGWVGIAGGPIMAGAELFTIKLTGKGGHGAAPQLTIDPICRGITGRNRTSNDCIAECRATAIRSCQRNHSPQWDGFQCDPAAGRADGHDPHIRSGGSQNRA